MTILGLAASLLLVAGTAANFAQSFPHDHRPDTNEARLPGGKSQVEALLKEDHKHLIQEAAQLLELADSLKNDLEKEDRHVLSVSSLKKTEEIEKLAKKIRARLKRF